jgi:hypothetical protein
MASIRPTSNETCRLSTPLVDELLGVAIEGQIGTHSLLSEDRLRRQHGVNPAALRAALVPDHELVVVPSRPTAPPTKARAFSGFANRSVSLRPVTGERGPRCGTPGPLQRSR